MTPLLEQSLNRLEDAIEQMNRKDIPQPINLQPSPLQKALASSAIERPHERHLDLPVERPLREMPCKTGSKMLHKFVKSGEKALSSQDGSGSLVIRKPAPSNIISNPQAPTYFRNIAASTTISTDHLEIVREKTNSDAGWASETTLEAETASAELLKILIPVHEMYARTRISQRLIDDGVIDLEKWLMDTISQRFNGFEEDAFINGTGQRMPRGFLNYERTTSQTLEWGKLCERRTGLNGLIVDADIFLDTVSSLKTQYLSGAVWLMSRSAFAEIRRLKDVSTGRYLWQPNLQDGGGNMLLGYPIVLSDAMPGMRTDAPTTPIAFGNFLQGYQIVDRGEFTILRDPYSAKPLVEFYVTQRLGGDVVDFDAIKLITTGE